MKIYGAGMAGLVAANMLRRFEPIVLEKQSNLPDNHTALLRFRTESLAHATGIPMRKVVASKGVYDDGEIYHHSTIKDCNQYSQKVTGKILPRSISDLGDRERWVAPNGFLNLLSKGAKIEFGSDISSSQVMHQVMLKDEPTISTLPMPIMMDIVGWKDKPKFDSSPIHTLRAEIPLDCDVHQTVYFPDPYIGCYRASITGSTLIFESTEEIHNHEISSIWEFIMGVFGIEAQEPRSFQIGTQKFGKISPVDESIRQAFILYLTQQLGIYSLGRFATWRNILLDDVVHDVEVIENLISKGSYSASLKSAGN